jgi:hypothetical protein
MQTFLSILFAAPIFLILLAVVVVSFIFTLHRRRERAWGGSHLTPNLTTSPSVYVPGKVRTVQSPYYDSYVIQAGSTVGGTQGFATMFSNVQGTVNSLYPNGVPANITNMTQANQLQGGESFLLGSFRIVPIGMQEVDFVTFCQNFDVRLIIGSGNYAYCDAPAEYWAGGAGSFTPGTGTASTNGVPDARAIVPFDVDPILLTDGVNFRVNLLGTPFTAAGLFFLRIYLDGQKTQPAQ